MWFLIWFETEGETYETRVYWAQTWPWMKRNVRQRGGGPVGPIGWPSGTLWCPLRAHFGVRGPWLIIFPISWFSQSSFVSWSLYVSSTLIFLYKLFCTTCGSTIAHFMSIKKRETDRFRVSDTVAIFTCIEARVCAGIGRALPKRRSHARPAHAPRAPPPHWPAFY
jgi:hypothetical protein